MKEFFFATVGFLCGISVGLLVTLTQIEPIASKCITSVEAVQNKLLLLHVCFANGSYNAHAHPACPAFRQFIVNEANKTDAEITYSPGE